MVSQIFYFQTILLKRSAAPSSGWLGGCALGPTEAYQALGFSRDTLDTPRALDRSGRLRCFKNRYVQAGQTAVGEHATPAEYADRHQTCP